MKKEKTQQSYNWLLVGQQRTGKTTTALALAAQFQYNAFLHNKVRRVLIYNPEGKNPIFEERASIIENIRYIIPNFKLPGYFRKINVSEIDKVMKARDNLFDWIIVKNGSFQEFFDNAKNIRDTVIIIDDQNNAIKGNLSARRFDNVFGLVANNRMASNDILFTYHSFKQVPPSLWTYFQRAIIKQTDDTDRDGFRKIQKAQDVLIDSQMQVRAENKVIKYPDNLKLSERLVWLNEEYVFRKINDIWVTKIDDVYYKAVDGNNIDELNKPQ